MKKQVCQDCQVTLKAKGCAICKHKKQAGDHKVYKGRLKTQ
jgi:hypothetical protein